jgi:coiled-coil domain-containing protein 12
MVMSEPGEVKAEAVGQLEEEARRRKDRLRALRQKLQGEDKEETRKVDVGLPKPVFRSYNPQDEVLQDSSKPKAKPIDIKSQVADTLEQGEIKTLLDDVELTNLAPRKPDWDLKRDVAPKLLKLERRTQRAIAELIMERLKDSQDLAAAVQIGPNVQGDEADDE